MYDKNFICKTHCRNLFVLRDVLYLCRERQTRFHFYNYRTLNVYPSNPVGQGGYFFYVFANTAKK
jgi:hypothetical protein